MELINTERKSPAGYLRGYIDGRQYEQCGTFREHPQALRFQLYYDDVEVVNPLGSKKTGIHKLGLFYYSVLNLPKHINCTMNSIHLLAVCYASDLKQYGFEPVLKPFIDEMKQLEGDDGVEIEVDGRPVRMFGTLVSFSADSLAAHELLGFLSPSANMLCRLCKAS